jgi:drug/metabolite transporter (DMT)-like permease
MTAAPDSLAPTTFAAVLLSAFLHAAWNAWVKAQPDPRGALVANVTGAGIQAIALLALTGPPDRAAWPWLAAGVAINLCNMVLMARAYAGGDFGVIYPLMRGVVPLVLALAAPLLFRETLAGIRLAGILAVSAGIAALAWEASRRARSVTLPGLGYAAAAALFTAGYVLVDAQAARLSGNAMAYAAAISVGNGAALALVEAARGRNVLRALAAHRGNSTIGAGASLVSYFLFVWALAQGPVALAAALRETSVPFAVLIAVLVLKERVGAARLAAIALVVLGAVLIRA